MEKIKQFLKEADLLMISTTIYLLLPIFIFLVSWTKIVYTILFIGLIVWFIKAKKDEFKVKTKNELEKKDIKKLVIVLIIILVWLALSGVGGLVRQTGDYEKHNAVLHDLIEKDYPVEYISKTSLNEFLVYYIAYYLPAAIVGKLLGFTAANVFLFIWTFIGLTIGMFWIFRITKKISIIPIICMIVFGGLEIIGMIIMGAENIFEIAHKEWWIKDVLMTQLSSLTTLLHWVPQMFIPALIITPILYFYKDKKMPEILFLFIVASFLWSPFICIGLLPFFLYNCIRRIKEEGISNIISTPTYLVCLLLTIILVAYVLSNQNNGADTGLLWKVQDIEISKFIPYFLLFQIIEYGALAIFVNFTIKEKKERIYLGITVLVLLVFTAIAGGKYNDFCMRTTIPALITIYIMFVQTILNAKKEKNKKILIICAIFAVLISFSSVNEIVSRIQNTEHIGGQYIDGLKTLEKFPNKSIRRQYLSQSYKESFFYFFIMK